MPTKTDYDEVVTNILAEIGIPMLRVTLEIAGRKDSTFVAVTCVHQTELDRFTGAWKNAKYDVPREEQILTLTGVTGSYATHFSHLVSINSELM